jgi:hypothetical protein
MRFLTKVLLLSLMAVVACERRPLFDPNETAMLKIRLVTEGIHNVTCDIYNPNVEVPHITSDMLRVLIYDPSGAPILSQGFISQKRIDENNYEVFSGPLALSAGEYRMLGYNFDVDYIRIRKESDYNTIEASTLEVPRTFYSRFGSRAEDLGIICYAPEHLMVARAPKIVVQPQTQARTIELDAHTIVDTYYIQIRIKGAHNMAQNASCQAVLTGVAQSNCFGPNLRNYDEPASLYFEMKRNTDPNTPEGENADVLCAVFNTFGKIPDAESRLVVTLSILTRDGQTHQKEIDLTTVFQTEDARERHWLLIDQEWEIPAPVVSGGGGFAPDVEDWEDVEDIIPIGPKG